MTKDDYQVIAYKIMAYFYACLKEGVEGSPDKALELAGCNKTYFVAVLSDLIESGYMAGEAGMDYAQELMCDGLRITLKGVDFLDGSSSMAKVRKALGKAFETVLATAVAATSLL